MFKKAERKQAKLKIALTGPSGSGKTFSALTIASGMGKRVALIDTENQSASLYADKFDFDALALDAPYTIAKYIHAIDAAEKAGYDVVVIDSLSHAWAGDGGLLSKKEALDSRGGNSFLNWGSITKEHEAFKAKILSCKTHLIATMRSKQDYVLDVNEKGKSTPRKIGLAPIQRDGTEYEFTLVLDLGMNHEAAASKDRTSLFDGQIFKPTRETGETIMKWLEGGKPEESTPKSSQQMNDWSDPPKDLLKNVLKSSIPKSKLIEVGKQAGWTNEDIAAEIASRGKTRFDDFSHHQKQDLIDWVTAHPRQENKSI